MTVANFFTYFFKSKGVLVDLFCLAFFCIVYKYPHRIPSFPFNFSKFTEQEAKVNNRVIKIITMLMICVDLLVILLIAHYVIVFQKPWLNEVLLDIPALIYELKNFLR